LTTVALDAVSKFFGVIRISFPHLPAPTPKISSSKSDISRKDLNPLGCHPKGGIDPTVYPVNFFRKLLHVIFTFFMVIVNYLLYIVFSISINKEGKNLRRKVGR